MEREGGAHEPERAREPEVRGILRTLSDVSLCEALLATDLLLPGGSGGARNPPVACDVPAPWLLWMWMVEGACT